MYKNETLGIKYNYNIIKDIYALLLKNISIAIAVIFINITAIGLINTDILAKTNLVTPNILFLHLLVKLIIFPALAYFLFLTIIPKSFSKYSSGLKFFIHLIRTISKSILIESAKKYPIGYLCKHVAGFYMYYCCTPSTSSQITLYYLILFI